MAKDVATLSVHMPISLRERARRIAKQLRTNTNQLIRDGLEKHLDTLEEKRLAEEKRAAEDKELRRRINGRALPKLGESPLGPKKRVESAENEQAENPPPPVQVDPLDEVYDRHAVLIASAVRDGLLLDKRLRVAEALMEIKRLAPLTHPPDSVIVSELERRVVALVGGTAVAPVSTPAASTLQDRFTNFIKQHIEQPVKRLADEITGKTLPTSIRTYGYVPTDKDQKGDEE